MIHGYNRDSKRPITVKEALECLTVPAQVIGDPNVVFQTIGHPSTDKSDVLIWISPAHRLGTFDKIKAKAIVSTPQLCAEIMKAIPGSTAIATELPKFAFMEIARHFFQGATPPGIHPSALLDSAAMVSPSASIGAFCTIGKAIIGDHTVIGPHCHIGDNTQIGRNVMVKAGTVIGGDGFGHEWSGSSWQNFPHVGGVLIDDDVEIGANTCIDQGSLGPTIIRRGARIDNLVHIAHNVEIGSFALVIANAMLGGSSVVGAHAWIAPNAAIRDGITIGSRAVVGLGAVVTKSVPESETWVGTPAKAISRK